MVIQGIPISHNKKNSKTESKVLTVLKKTDENISHHDIDIAHRLGESKTSKTPDIILRFVSGRTRNNIYKEKRKLKCYASGKHTSERVFINVNLTKRKNIYLSWPMKKEKNLTGNAFGPTTEELFRDKAMTAKSLLSEVKKTLNISNTQCPTLEIPTKFLHLNQFENSPVMKHLFLLFDVVSGLHVISLAWCVVHNLFLHLFNNHGFA